MRSAMLCLLVIYGSGLLYAQEKACSEKDLRLAKAFLYQNFIERGGRTFSAAVFADREINGLRDLAEIDRRDAEKVRLLIESDYNSHRVEYVVRGHVAQSKVAGDTSRIHIQEALWSEFLNDPRYVHRLCAGGIPKSYESAPREMVVAPAEIRTLYDGITKNISEMPSREGCAANPLTVFGTLKVEDSLLAATVFDIIVSQEGNPPIDAVYDEVVNRGWTIRSR